jgi:hypothetical protein
MEVRNNQTVFLLGKIPQSDVTSGDDVFQSNSTSRFNTNIVIEDVIFCDKFITGNDVITENDV